VMILKDKALTDDFGYDLLATSIRAASQKDKRLLLVTVIGHWILCCQKATADRPDARWAIALHGKKGLLVGRGCMYCVDKKNFASVSSKSTFRKYHQDSECNKDKHIVTMHYG
jgi:hypothetical protein